MPPLLNPSQASNFNRRMALAPMQAMQPMDLQCSSLPLFGPFLSHIQEESMAKGKILTEVPGTAAKAHEGSQTATEAAAGSPSVTTPVVTADGAFLVPHRQGGHVHDHHHPGKSGGNHQAAG